MTPWAKGLAQASDILIRRGSAMGSLLPLLFLVPFFLGAAWLFREQPVVSIILGICAITIVFEYCRQYANFAKHDPDRLQSEEYRYEMRKMQMIASKELPYPVPVDSLEFPPATSNPNLPFPKRGASEESDAENDGKEHQ